MVVAVVVTGLSCFSTARYDHAHVQRVVNIDARYDEETRQEYERHASLATELDTLRASVIPIKPESSYAPVNRIDEREDIVECRRLCNDRAPGSSTELQHNRNPAAAQCVREICQPAYVDALSKRYFDADVTWVTSQLSSSNEAELESLLAFSHNRALLGTIDQQARASAQRHAHARSRVERERRREIEASMQLRDSEIASGRAAHRARVKAAADTFAAVDHGIPPVARTTHAAPAATADPSSGCASDLGCSTGHQCVTPTYGSSGTCVPAVDDCGNPTTARAHLDPVEPTTGIGCKIRLDCPGGFTCDVATGLCLR
jgi:hypothetical protein